LIKLNFRPSFNVCIDKNQKLQVVSLAHNFTVVVGFQRFSNKALLITLTELSAIAAPATTGFKNPNAASGMPATL
jgi:hypothetical protein